MWNFGVIPVDAIPDICILIMNRKATIIHKANSEDVISFSYPDTLRLVQPSRKLATMLILWRCKRNNLADRGLFQIAQKAQYSQVKRFLRWWGIVARSFFCKAGCWSHVCLSLFGRIRRCGLPLRLTWRQQTPTQKCVLGA